MGGFFDRVGNFFSRDKTPDMPNDVEPPSLAGDQNAVCIAALIIGALMIMRR